MFPGKKCHLFSAILPPTWKTNRAKQLWAEDLLSDIQRIKVFTEKQGHRSGAWEESSVHPRSVLMPHVPPVGHLTSWPPFPHLQREAMPWGLFGDPQNENKTRTTNVSPVTTLQQSFWMQTMSSRAPKTQCLASDTDNSCSQNSESAAGVAGSAAQAGAGRALELAVSGQVLVQEDTLQPSLHHKPWACAWVMMSHLPPTAVTQGFSARGQLE